MSRPKAWLKLIVVAGSLVAITSCDFLRPLLGRSDEAVEQTATTPQMPPPATREIEVQAGFSVTTSALDQLSVLSSAGNSTQGQDLEIVDLGVGQPLFLTDQSGDVAIPIYVSGDSIASGALQATEESVAFALLRLTPPGMLMDSSSEEDFLERCREHVDFTDLISDISTALATDPATLLDATVWPDLYRTVAVVASDTIKQHNPAQARRLRRDIYGDESTVHLEDLPEFGERFSVINPKATFYGLDISSGDPYLVDAKEGFLEWRWPPFAEPATTDAKISSDGDYRLVLYKGFNSDDGFTDWINPLSAAGKATYANSLMLIRIGLKTAGLVTTATGAGAGVGTVLGQAASELSTARIKALLRMHERLRDQEWIKTFGAIATLKSNPKSPSSLIEKTINDIAKDWDEISLLLWESPDWSSEEHGVNAADLLRHLGKAVKAVAKGLDIAGLANEALPFLWDLALAPWRIEYQVSSTDNFVQLRSTLQPPTAQIAVDTGNPGVGSQVGMELTDVADDVDSVADLEVRWDFDGDGTFETEWQAVTAIQHTYSVSGVYSIIAEVRDGDDQIGRVTYTVNVGRSSWSDSIVTYPGAFPVVKSPVTVRAFIARDNYVVDLETNEFTTWYEDVTDVSFDLEQVAIHEMSNRLNLAVAAGDLPDAVVGGNLDKNHIAHLGRTNVLHNLRDEIQDHSKHLADVLVTNPYIVQNTMTPEGAVYFLPRIAECYHCTLSQKMFVYAPWLSALGIDVPTTTEEFRSMLIAFKTQDPNGNGVYDEVPLAGARFGWHAKPHEFLMQPFEYSDGLTYLAMDNGIVRFAAASDGWREGLSYLSRLSEDGLLAVGSFDQPLSDVRTLGENPGDVILGAASAGWYGLFTENYGSSGRFLEYEAIPPLLGPDGIRRTARYSYTVQPSLLVMQQYQHPEVMVRWADWLYTWEGAVSAVQGPIGVAWVYAQPGETAYTGYPATHRSLPEYSLYGQPENGGWDHAAPVYQSRQLRETAATSLVDYTIGQEYRLWRWSRDLYEPYALSIDSVVPDPFMEPSETDDFLSMRSSIVDAVDDWARRFGTGEMDINDDADWAQYLSELQSLGVDRYVELVQSNYASQTW